MPGFEARSKTARLTSRSRSAISPPDDADRCVEGDVLVVVPHGCLGRRCEHRFGKPIGFTQPSRHSHVVDGASRGVLLPRGSGHVRPDDAFHRQHGRPTTDHDPPCEFIAARACGGRSDTSVDNKWLSTISPTCFEPPGRHGGEHPALVGYRFGHHHIERAQTISSPPSTASRRPVRTGHGPCRCGHARGAGPGPRPTCSQNLLVLVSRAPG